MRRILLGAAVLAAGGALAGAAGTAGWYLHRFFGKEPAGAPLRGSTPAEERILAALAGMRERGQIHFGIPESDGRRLRLLAESIGAKNVVEVGTSTGYSALWLALGTDATGGKITTFEIDPARAEIARNAFRQAGVEGRVEVVVGDAHRNVPAIQGPIDLVFLDADKEGYVDYMNTLLPLVRPGGLILAHNVEAAPEFLRLVAQNPALETVRLTQGSGLSVTLKKL